MNRGGIESLPASAGVVHVGPGSFVMPWPQFRATTAQVAAIETATVAFGSPQLAGIGPRLLAEIEAEMAREQRRRERTPPEGRAIRVPVTDPADLEVDGAAFYTSDEGDRPERILVTVLTERGYELGPRPSRHVFTDEGEMIVLEHELEPAVGYVGPIHLAPGRDLGLPVIDTPDGRVYSPDPFRGRDVVRAPVMEKFDRIAPMRPENVEFDAARLNPTQRLLLTTAEKALKAAEDMKLARTKFDTDGAPVSWGRMTKDERDERVVAKEAFDKLQVSLLDRRETSSVSRGLVETIALEKGRQGAFAVTKQSQLRRETGLDSLLTSGAITLPEFVAGEKYGAAFQAARSSLKVATWEGIGGGGAVSNPEIERARRLRDLEAKSALTTLDALVQARVKSPRAVSTLRLVAGHGRHVSHFSKGASRSKNVDALKLALAALADNWGLQ